MDAASVVQNGLNGSDTINEKSEAQRSEGDSLPNGISNGLNDGKKEHSKHKDRDSHKDKDRSKDKDRDRHKDKHREKDKEHKHSSSSSSKDKEKSKDGSSSSSRDKEKDRSKDKDKDKHRDRSKDEKRDKDKSSSSHREKEKSSSSSHRDKDSKHSSSSSKHSSSSSSKDKEKQSLSPSKDKERADKDKERTDKDRSKDKERSDKEKQRDKEKDKSRHSSGDKDRSKEKDRSKDRDKSEKKDRKDDKHRKDKESALLKIKADESLRMIKEEMDEPDLDKAPPTPTIPTISHDPPSMKVEIKDEPEDSFNLEVDMSADQSQLKEEDMTVDDSEIKQEEESDDDVPLSARKSFKREAVEDEDDEDDAPLSVRKKVKKEEKKKKRKKEPESEYDEEEEEDFKPKKKKTPKVKKEKNSVKPSPATSPTKAGRKKKEEEEQEVWKWWEEEKKTDGRKWTFLEHKGPVFAPLYERLPPEVEFLYDGKEMKLSEETEEVATFYGRMLDHDYTSKEAFNKNFFKDWRKVMTNKEREIITDLKKCNFRNICAYFQKKSEERKAMSKEEKKAIKEQNDEIQKEYGFCKIDGHKEKIGNFRIEPPSLFRGRGEHPKMGMLKRRVLPSDVIINCSKDSKWPVPPDGHKWKEVRHDNSVTWLASWTENVQGQVKYVMLNPSSKLKGEKDWQKYETARKLAKSIDKIREDYRNDWKSKEMRIRQRAVAMYFIDILALRAGNEKDEDQADTVGCCSLRVEHISLHPEKDGKEFVVVFDFLGKDSIRYYNEVPVEKRVFKNLQLFMENKKEGDDLFDRLNTGILNKHLNELMEGLTAKVFRTYNASWTLQQQLNKLTDPNYSLPEMILAYNRANRAVAILCNHQRSVPKSHEKSMQNLQEKINTKKEQVAEAEKQYKDAKKDAKRGGSVRNNVVVDKKKKALERLREQLRKLEVQETDREENKTIALGTSKLNYLDPRISVAWCKKYDVPIDKIYNKTQRDKFRWAIDMAGADYVF
ncbi:TOPEUc [Nesidiocoris tenuis]|uniref:DNA topoisomerase I n=1 Tax=Nesidiocoris tenuis TaxID=355587 RepID=A0ABN7A9F9_9HEMI|nr:TOPEUc [Nesidiocoris tenuis]